MDRGSGGRVVSGRPVNLHVQKESEGWFLSSKGLNLEQMFLALRRRTGLGGIKY